MLSDYRWMRKRFQVVHGLVDSILDFGFSCNVVVVDMVENRSFGLSLS